MRRLTTTYCQRTLDLDAVVVASVGKLTPWAAPKRMSADCDSQIISAIKEQLAVLDAPSPSAAELEAARVIADAWAQHVRAVPIAVSLLLADSSVSSAVRIVALQVLGAAVAAAGGDGRPDVQAGLVDIALRSSATPRYVRVKVGGLITDLMLREFPQRWASLPDALCMIASQSAAAAEVVAVSLQGAIAQCKQSDDVLYVSATRRKQVLQALSATATRWLPPLLAVLERACAGEVARDADWGMMSAAAAAIVSLLGELAFAPVALQRDARLTTVLRSVWNAPLSGNAHEDSRVRAAVIDAAGMLARRRFDVHGTDEDEQIGVLALLGHLAATAIGPGFNMRAAGEMGTQIDGIALRGLASSISGAAALLLEPVWRVAERAPTSTSSGEHTTALGSKINASVANLSGITASIVRDGGAAAAVIRENAAVAAADAASAAAESYLAALLALLQHPSVYIVNDAASALCDALVALSAERTYGGLIVQRISAASARPLVQGLVREERFAAAQLRVALPPSQSNLLFYDICPGGNRADDLAVRRSDFYDNEASEYEDVFRECAVKCARGITLIASLPPPSCHTVEDVLLQLVHCARDAAIAVAGPERSDRAAGTYAVVSAARLLDAASTTVAAILVGLPRDDYTSCPAPLTSMDTRRDTSVNSTTAEKMHDAMSVLLSVPCCNPRVASRVARALAAFSPCIHVSHLGATLQRLFELVRYVDDVLPTVESQRVRHCACVALVALSRSQPLQLLSVLQALSHEVFALLQQDRELQLLSAADRSSLLEVLVLVSNALAYSDAAAHAAFFTQLVAAPLSHWTGALMTTTVSSTSALLGFLYSNENEGAKPSPNGDDALRASLRCDAIDGAVHLLLAVARRCTAAELSNVATAHRANYLDAHISPPQHPFWQLWLTVLPNVVALIGSLHGVWSRWCIERLMEPILAQERSQVATSGMQNVHFRYILALSRDCETALAGRGNGADGSADCSDDGGGSGDDDEQLMRNHLLTHKNASPRKSVAREFDVPVFRSALDANPVKLQRILLTSVTRKACDHVSAWYTRVLSHCWGLISLASRGHVIPDVSQLASTSRSVHKRPDSPVYGCAPIPPRLLDPAIYYLAWPAIAAALQPDVVRAMPLRVQHILLTQAIPALVDAVRYEVGPLSGEIVRSVLDVVGAVLCASVTALAAGDSTVDRPSDFAAPALNATFGVLLPRNSRHDASYAESIQSAIRRDFALALIDVVSSVLTLIPAARAVLYIPSISESCAAVLFGCISWGNTVVVARGCALLVTTLRRAELNGLLFSSLHREAPESPTVDCVIEAWSAAAVQFFCDAALALRSNVVTVASNESVVIAAMLEVYMQLECGRSSTVIADSWPTRNCAGGRIRASGIFQRYFGLSVERELNFQRDVTAARGERDRRHVFERLLQCLACFPTGTAVPTGIHDGQNYVAATSGGSLGIRRVICDIPEPLHAPQPRFDTCIPNGLPATSHSERPAGPRSQNLTDLSDVATVGLASLFGDE